MGYVDITLGRYWGVPEFKKLKNNFEYFIEEITAKQPISPMISVEMWNDVTYDMTLTDIQNLFTNVEMVTWQIDMNTNWINDYSINIDYGDNNPIHWREWEKKQPNKYMLVKRWLDWMRYHYLIISGQEEKQQHLYSYEPDGSGSTLEQIYDSSGEPIRTLEGYF